MSSRGFLLRIHDDDSYDQPEMRPLSPNIIVSRSDYFAAREEGEKWTNQFSSINKTQPEILFIAAKRQ